MVTMMTSARLVLGGVIGWWVLGHAVGVVLGILGGLLGSVIPLAIGSFILACFQQCEGHK
jgi:hypothetical protein